MKIAVIGAGAMGAAIVKDLRSNPEVTEILVADAALERAREIAAGLGDQRIRYSQVDASNVAETAKVITPYDAVVNAAQYYINCEVMKACLAGRCHYNDLGGMFHMTRRQHELRSDFEKAGLTAITGIGAAPGITNVLSRYGYDLLDRVEAVHTSFAAADLTDRRGVQVLVPPYSIRTIMEEMSDDSVQFMDGEYVVRPALSGAEESSFPEPIGRRVCYHTLHSEPATIPAAFRDKGIRHVTWRLSLPPELEEAMKTLAGAGFASTDPVEIGGAKISPRDILATVIEKNIAVKLKGVKIETREVACIRSHVIGTKEGRSSEVIADCIAHTPPGGSSLVGSVTSVPASVAAQLQASGQIARPGVWGPEEVIEPLPFFAELAKRGMRVQATVRNTLAAP